MKKPTLEVLVDRRNFHQVFPALRNKMAAALLVGIDLETTGRFSHPGMLKLELKKTVFDIRRTVITGLSIYIDGDDTTYYFNLFHADVENRLPWPWVRDLLDSKAKNAWWVAHNAPFELTMFLMCQGYSLGQQVICSLQLCVTAYGPDTYPMDKFMGPSLGGIVKMMPAIAREFAGYRYGDPLSNEQEDLLYKIIAKESDAEHSYNGFIKAIAYGYGLKQAVKSWFGYEMETYEAVLKSANAERMDELTGEQVVSYGCDDAYWAVKLYKRVLQYLMDTNPAAVETFFVQENPMVHEYAAIWMGGLKVNKHNILMRRDMERKDAARTLREMKSAIRDLMPFEQDPHDKLLKYDAKWYAKNGESYRDKLRAWAYSDDCDNDFEQVMQVRSPTSAAWAEERGVKESNGLNLTHYMPMRVVLYDLCRFSFHLADGKVQSDDETRTSMLRRYCKAWAEERGLELGQVYNADKNQVTSEELKQDSRVRVLMAYRNLAGIEQRMKLYLTPYLLLTDPETECMYPVLSSRLATRRTSCQFPNGQQLAKYGGSAYVRGFFEPDHEDHVLVSADWSAVELVIVGNYSQDPAFIDAYGTRPHRDIHSWTAAQMLRMPLEEFMKHPERKKLRTQLGKGGNFGYWYSGALGTVAREVGWTSEEMWEFTDVYREAFAVAEQWRVDTITTVRRQGYVELPDHLRRDRFEATERWAEIMRQKLLPYDVPGFAELLIRKIQNRAGNQAVNALVQGLCATLAKKKILKLRKMIAEKGYRARLWLLVHDELVCSVHKDDALAFMDDLYALMIDDEGIFKGVKLDSSLAVGKNFQPFDAKACPKGQIELMELNKGLPCVAEERWEKPATREERQAVLDYLCAV